MDDNFKIQCELSTNNPTSALGLEIWINGDKVFDSVITEFVHFEYRINDSADVVNNELKFVLKNKNDSHTTINNNGDIVNDSVIKIKNLKFDDIDISNVLYHLSEYHHNNNGHGDNVIDKFYGDMGCNGTVILKFTTPIYFWLLDNL